MKKQPTRESAITVIEQLLQGLIAREYVAEWAFSIIDDQDVVVTDKVLWEVIQCLGTVDLVAPDRDYLYENVDFNEWLNSLKTK